MPRRSRRVYLIDGIAFVPHPCARVGLYVKTHACVAQVACPFCKAVIGEPCRQHLRQGWSGSTHYARRRAAKGLAINHAVIVLS